MSFKDFVRKHNLKNKATSNIKIRQVLCSIGLNNVGIYLRDGPFESDKGIVNLHTSKGTHEVGYIDEYYFDSYGCVCAEKLSHFNIKPNGYCLYSEHQIQKNDSFCASYCLFIIYQTKIVGMNFKSAVLNLYYQGFS